MAKRVCSYKKIDFEISYEILNLRSDKSIIFLHGWGSNKEIMKQAFSKELKIFRQLYIDMPGFGNSFNDKFLTTQDYANIVLELLKELKISPDIVVGHSFGGKVATLINPKCLVLLSSSGILVPKPVIIKFKISFFKFLNRFGLRKARDIFVSSDGKGLNEGMYRTFKYVVNEDFEENFSKIGGKTLIFWGENDTATPLWTAEKIKSIIPTSQLFPLSGDHYFFLKHSKLIASEIEKNCY